MMRRLSSREEQQWVRQCAWCSTIMDATGTYSVESAQKVRTATHGICPTCKILLMGEIQESPPPAL